MDKVFSLKDFMVVISAERKNNDQSIKLLQGKFDKFTQILAYVSKLIIMNIDEEIQKVYVLLKNSAETLEDVLHKSFEIPVDNWSKEKPVLLFPDSGDSLQDLLELMSRIDKNLDQVRVNIRQFELNKFQVIKEEEFDPRYSQPLIDYEINEIQCEQIATTN